MRGLEDIWSKLHFLAKKVFLVQNPLQGQKNFLTKIFLVVIEVVRRPNFMQKIRKKYRTPVGPEQTYGQTLVQTHESEFIGSFRSLKTSGGSNSSNNVKAGRLVGR